MNPFQQAVINNHIKKESEIYGNKLQRVLENQWPIRRPDGLKEVWRSDEFLVQIFEESNGIERLSVVRARISGDRWQDGITWDDLQRLKNECGRGNKCATEIYPADKDVVNVANMRHLWVLPEPPKYVWKVV